jgi:uncharacterized protein (DUF2141 family)
MALAWALLACGALFPCVSRAATIVVRITGLNNHKGQLRVGLFTHAEGWLTEHGAAVGRNVPLAGVTGDCVDVTFESVAPGEYAVGLFHDENMNGKLDKNFLGMPKEQWGVSNNAHPPMRPPNFDEAQFKLTETVKTVEIALRK